MRLVVADDIMLTREGIVRLLADAGHDMWLLGTATKLAVRLAGGDPHAARSAITTEEIRDMIAAQVEFSAERRTIISCAFDIADRVLRQIVLPRRDVVCLPAGLPSGDGVDRLVASGYSRAPVTGPLGLDDVAGVVHLCGLVHADGNVAEHAHPPLYLPETLKVSDALRQMRQQHEHFALVVDEFGAVDGIVTLEDLVEEIVGEIYDEADRDVEAVVHEPGGSMLLTGAFPLHDLPHLGVNLGDPRRPRRRRLRHRGRADPRPSRHIPTGPGERVDLGRYTAEVTEVTRHAITKVRLHPNHGPTSHRGNVHGRPGR